MNRTKLNDILANIDSYDLNEEYDIFIDEYILNEGLIKTWPIDKSVSILKSNRYKCDIDLKKETCFNAQLYKDDDFDKLLKLTNNFGYFPSYVWFMVGDVSLDKGKFLKSEVLDNRDKYESIIIRFEPKYDLRVDTIPKYLYHVTTREKSIKILHFGLIPKSNSITSHHPSRVYLGLDNDSLEKMIRNNPNSWDKSRDGKWSILKINTAMIPNYFQIYRDPNAKEFGLFTLNNIPSKAIEIDRIFSIE